MGDRLALHIKGRSMNSAKIYEHNQKIAIVKIVKKLKKKKPDTENPRKNPYPPPQHLQFFLVIQC